jgi:hypothetical protein
MTEVTGTEMTEATAVTRSDRDTETHREDLFLFLFCFFMTLREIRYLYSLR